MTATHVIAARQNQALTELATILERHDPEAAARLAKTNHGGGVPTSPKKPLENASTWPSPSSSSPRSWRTGS